jgi:hypothetical protein
MIAGSCTGGMISLHFGWTLFMDVDGTMHFMRDYNKLPVIATFHCLLELTWCGNLVHIESRLEERPPKHYLSKLLP